MQSNKTRAYGLFASLFLFLLGLIFTSSVELGICIANETVTDAQCINYFERVGDPMLYGGLALSIVFALLLLAPSTFGVWKRFAVWFIPLATLLFIFYPEPGAWDFLSPMPEQLFQWVSIFYVAVSAILIGYAHIAKQK